MHWRELIEELSTTADAAPEELLPSLLGELETIRARLWMKLHVGSNGHGHKGAESAELLSPDEVARQLKVGRRWVYRHAAELGETRLSDRCLRFRRSEVERYIARRQRARR